MINPYGPERTMIAPPKKQVLRFRRNWDRKLFPVDAMIFRSKGAPEYWPDDTYSVEIKQDNQTIVISQRHNGAIVKFINGNDWTTVGYSYVDQQSVRHDVCGGLELVELGEDE